MGLGSCLRVRKEVLLISNLCHYSTVVEKLALISTLLIRYGEDKREFVPEDFIWYLEAELNQDR